MTANTEPLKKSVSATLTGADKKQQNSPSELRVSFGGQSIAGIKSKNEDAFAAYLPASESVNTLKGVATCIADGVSCSENAQLASQTAVTLFIDDYYSTPESGLCAPPQRGFYHHLTPGSITMAARNINLKMVR